MKAFPSPSSLSTKTTTMSTLSTFLTALMVGTTLAHIYTLPAFVSVPHSSPFVLPSRSLSYSKNHEGGIRCNTFSALSATVQQQSGTTDPSSGLDHDILSRIADAAASSREWAQDFDLVSESGALFHALFSGIRSSAALGIRGKPFYLKSEDVMRVMMKDHEGVHEEEEEEDMGNKGFVGFFTFDDLAKALQDDFLDASRGSTDVRQGWKVTSVSTPRGSSFEDARMTLEEVQSALDKGTVIFNTAGAHIPKLAGATLACTDASSLPCAVNMYVTAAGKRTSAPPHTDRQDVIVVQTQGKKHWRVYSPPDPTLKPNADVYARGKGDDVLSLYSLEDVGCEKLLDVTLEPGDVLFIPAAYPHTTDTVTDLVEDTPENTSIHLTFNFDTHVWDLNYLSARRLALRRAGVMDSALGQEREEDSPYVGKVNVLPKDVREELLSNLPLDFLDETRDLAVVVDSVTAELKRISKSVDAQTFDAVPDTIWRETVERLQNQGMKLLEIHRDMYLAAVEEGRERKAEEAMTAHLSGDALVRARAMTPEKMQRLSLFRVQKYFEKINEAKKSLRDWTRECSNNENSIGSALPADWEFTLPLKVGDQVEADLGGAFFPATVTKVAGGRYDVKFFDGDVMNGLDRNQIKLLAPPASVASSIADDTEEAPPGLTPKELKRWRKKQEKTKTKK